MGQWELRKQELTDKRDQFTKSITGLDGKAAYLEQRKEVLRELISKMAEEGIQCPPGMGLEGLAGGGPTFGERGGTRVDAERVPRTASARPRRQRARVDADR